MSNWSWKMAAAAAGIIAATGYTLAQMPGGHEGMHGSMNGAPQATQPPAGTAGPMHEHMMHMMETMHGEGMPNQGMHGPMGAKASSDRPTMPGQDAFGTIQEIVRMLEADPKTDWSKVNIAGLREHLIDMSEVTLHAVADQRAIDGGVEILVTGEGRTLPAIRRMVPAHAHELAALGWSARTEDLPNGVKLTVTSTDPSQAAKLRALGFMGIMVQGTHHQLHHLMMARGEFAH
jgi:hypothetical protein